jgi:FKBP-type peptidyl-prolyl cis-trans isomerase FkpA
MELSRRIRQLFTSLSSLKSIKNQQIPMKHFLLSLAVLSVIILASCGGKSPFPNYEEAENGTYFLLHTKGEGTATVDTGGAVFVKLKFKTAKDSVFFDINAQAQTQSYPIRVEKSDFKGDFMDMFTRMHPGDSASFFVRLDSLKKYHKEEFKFDAKYDTMKYLGFAVKIDSIYDREKVLGLMKAAQAENQKRQDMMMAMKAQEPAAIQKYVSDNKITATPSATGVYYIEKTKGKGDNVKKGQTVTIKYTGKFLDGQIFDSSDNSGQPLTFVVGQMQVVPGMDEGIQQFKKGGKGTLIIPSDQAYGDGGGRMKPFATLVFDIEVVDVKDGAPAPAPMHP